MGLPLLPTLGTIAKWAVPPAIGFVIGKSMGDSGGEKNLFPAPQFTQPQPQPLPAQPVTEQPVRPLPSTPQPNIDWNALAKVFSDPRATPAFYKMALGMLVDLLSHQRGMEQLNIQRQVASARDITPLVNYASTLETQLANLYKLYPELTNQFDKAYTAYQIQLLSNQLGNIRNLIFGKYGIPSPTTNIAQPSGNPETQSKKQPKSVLGIDMGNILGSLIP